MIPTASQSPFNDLDPIKTGLFIDRLSGIGGIPRKRITEIFGDESVGKSSLCLQIVASAQRDGKRCLWADMEYSYTLGYAASLGVDNDTLGLLQEPNAEDLLNALESAIDSGEYDLVVLDSIGALRGMAEAEKGYEGNTIGVQAKLVARFCRNIAPLLALKNTALIVINHSVVDLLTGKIGQSGGKKLAYHKAFSVRLRQASGKSGKKWIMQGETPVGKVVLASVTKNKIGATEGMEVEASILFGEGFAATQDILQQALDAGVIVKDRASYLMDGEKIAYGSKNMSELLKDESFLETLKSRI